MEIHYTVGWHLKHTHSGYIKPEIVKSLLTKTNGMCKRNYLFRMNIMEEIFEIDAEKFWRMISKSTQFTSMFYS